jgi:hypothetical protein
MVLTGPRSSQINKKGGKKKEKKSKGKSETKQSKAD